MGSNPVINITFKDIKFDETEIIDVDLKELIAKLYQKHRYVMEILEDYEIKNYYSTLEKV